jgi:hypothetical protein
MASSESIAQRLHGQLDELIGEVRDVGGRQPSEHETEERLWQAMLEIGRGLLQLRFEACREAEVIQETVEVNGECYAYQRRSRRQYVSLFGEVQVERAGVCPLDAALSLPELSYSDSVQERLSEINVWMPQAQSVALMERWLGLKIPKGSLQSSSSQQALYVEDYYAQRQLEPAPETDSILVVSADGKGIPMTRTDSPPLQARRSKGQKKTATKEAVVTAVYSVAPHVRDSASILAALLPDQTEQPKPTPPRPTPNHKQIFGTMDGKTAALSHLAQQVARRDSSPFVHRVALTDGAAPLQQRVQAQFPAFTLVLDVIHVTEHLWDAANARWGETSPDRLPWIRQALTWLLENQLDALLLDLHAQEQGLPADKRQVLAHVSTYLRRNRPYMDYQRFLALGWPIGTGVIEGACCHLVKDRFEQAGMRWSKAGAQSLLDLRSVAFNDDWDDFQRFRRQQSHQERYDFPYPDSLPDALAFEAAA